MLLHVSVSLFLHVPDCATYYTSSNGSRVWKSTAVPQGGHNNIKSFALFAVVFLINPNRHRGVLTVLVAGVGAGAFQSVEVLREHGQVGLWGTLIILRVRRLLHHLLYLLYHLNDKADTNMFTQCFLVCFVIQLGLLQFAHGYLQTETVFSCVIPLPLVSGEAMAPMSMERSKLLS